MLSPDQIQAARTQYGVGGPASAAPPTATPQSVDDRMTSLFPKRAAATPPASTEPSFASRVGSDLGTRAKNIGGILANAGSNPVKNLGETQLQGIGELAGGVNDVIGEGLKSAYQVLPQSVKQGIEGTVGTAAKAVGAPDLIQQYQAFAEKHPDAHKDLSALFNIGTMLPLGHGAELAEGAAKSATEGLGEAAGKAGEAVKNLADKPLEVAQSLATPVPQDVRQILSAAERSPEASANVTKYFEHARDAVADKSALTPTEIAGKEQLGGALQELKAKMTKAAQSKEAALAESADQVVPTKTAYDNFTKKLSSILGTNFDPQGNLIPAFGRESLVTGSAADEKLISMVKDTMDTLQRDPSLQRVNDVVDKLQAEVNKSKQLGAVPLNSRTEAVVKGFVHDLNESAKEVAPDAYRSANAEYARLADLHGRLNKGLGLNMKNAGTLLSKVFGKTGADAKELLTQLEKETGRNIFEHATLAKFAEDSIKDPAAKALLEQAGKIPHSKEGFLQKIMEFATKNLKQPEAVATRLAETVPKAEAAAATGAAGGSIADLVSRLQKLVQEGNFPGMMSMKEVGVGPTSQIPEMAEIEANQAAKAAEKKVAPLDFKKTYTDSSPSGDKVKNAEVPLSKLRSYVTGLTDEGGASLKGKGAVDLSLDRDGIFHIDDGNHRVQQAIEDGYTHIPARVHVDEGASLPEDMQVGSSEARNVRN